MSLPRVHGEFVVFETPEIVFTDSGQCRLRVKLKAAEKKRDTNNQLVDGEPVFLNMVLWGQWAQNFADSVEVGDSVLVSGKFESFKGAVRIFCDEGPPAVTVRSGAVKSADRMHERGVQAAKDILGGAEMKEGVEHG